MSLNLTEAHIKRGEALNMFELPSGLKRIVDNID